ncbi:hypothetical protein V1280_004476 [Bradyrhizobium sp. AZCC 2230]
MCGVLDGHRRNEYHPGDYRLPGIAVLERTELDRQRSADDQQEHLKVEHDFEYGTPPRR